MNNNHTAATIILADDHPAFRAGVKQHITGRSDFHLLAEADNGRKCLDIILQYEPDWAVIDLAMPIKTGFDVLEELSLKDCLTKIIVMSMHAESSYANRAKNLGAVAFIAKEDALSELDKAIKTADDGFYMSRSVGLSKPDFLKEETSGLLDNLTRTETKVLYLLAQGLTSREIAESLNVSTRTVQAHRRNMSYKLNLRGPNRLMEFAVRNANKV